MEHILVQVKGMSLSEIRKIAPNITKLFKEYNINANFEYFEAPSSSLVVNKETCQVFGGRSVWIFALPIQNWNKDVSESFIEDLQMIFLTEEVHLA